MTENEHLVFKQLQESEAWLRTELHRWQNRTTWSGRFLIPAFVLGYLAGLWTFLP